MRHTLLGRFIGKRAPLVVIATCAVLVLGTAPAGADPVDDLLGGVEEAVGELGAPSTKDAPATPGPAPDPAPGPARVPADAPPVQQDDDPDKEMADPRAPDHGSADNAEVVLADEEVAAIGQTDAVVGDSDRSSADATALSLGGNEVVGAHAEGNERETAGDPLEPVCAGSEGALCAQLVYAEASSSDRNGAQESSADTSVANACVGGGDTAPEECDGAAGAGVLTSESDIERGRDGHTESSSSSAVAEACLVPDPVLGCTVGAEAVSSEGESSSRGSASKDSEVLALAIAGEEAALSDGPTGIELPPDCPADAHVACVYLEQGETYVGNSAAGHAVTALDATVLNGTVLAELSHTESLARKFPADPQGPGGPAGPSAPGAPGGPAAPAGPGDHPGGDASGGEAADGGLLPNTGGLWTGFLSLALAGIGLGSLLVAWSRRGKLLDGTS